MAKRWYAVHVFSNFERKVASAILEAAKKTGLDICSEDVFVPVEEYQEFRRGRKVNSERRFMPGYVLVKMEMMDEAYHLIRTLPRVTGFLGSQGEAVPLKDSEVEALIDRVEAGGAREGVAVLHEVGDKVMVVDGPFEGFAALYYCSISSLSYPFKLL
jgi:transcriptional antiterminator NusG